MFLWYVRVFPVVFQEIIGSPNIQFKNTHCVYEMASFFAYLQYYHINMRGLS